MRKIQSLLFVSILFLLVNFGTAAQDGTSNTETPGTYTLVVEGFDWGPAVSKLILDLAKPISEVNPKDYEVFAKRSINLIEIDPDRAFGQREVLSAFVSDAQGNRTEEGSHVTLILRVGPDLAIASPFQYIRNETHSGNFWVDYDLRILNTRTMETWDQQSGKQMPLIDRFDLQGRFQQDDISLSYAHYEPEGNRDKYPLIIWLHGGGEGGSDPTVPLLANKAANYASDDIQYFFGGAYVLVPQCPGAWMHNKDGEMTGGREDDIYNEALLVHIQDFVAGHPNIDTDRIYVGGCSNGGYMALKLILKEPDYFAAGYISALAYRSQYLSDAQIRSIRNVPIWFVHAKDDPTTVPDQTVVPVYQRLKDAGARNVHFSYYDHVTDITGIFGGEAHRYNGHWSWIYAHANHPRTDFDGSPVVVDGQAVTLMQWLAAQSK